jgi:hypothetical protein
LPNVKELQSLIDFGSYPAFPGGHPFSGVQAGYYWSSANYVGQPSHAWAVHVGYGYVSHGPKSLMLVVWPVRGGQ